MTESAKLRNTASLDHGGIPLFGICLIERIGHAKDFQLLLRKFLGICFLEASFDVLISRGHEENPLSVDSSVRVTDTRAE
jgi:hypothetical protein